MVFFPAFHQTGPTNATVEQLRDMATDKKEALSAIRQKLGANPALAAMLEDGAAEPIVSAALDQDGRLLIFVDDQHQM